MAALMRLFLEIAGEDREVDWAELKRILDHSMRDGKCIIGSIVTIFICVRNATTALTVQLREMRV